MSTKEAVIAMIQSMPDGVSWAEIVAEGTARFGMGDGDKSATPERQETGCSEDVNPPRVEETQSGKTVFIPAAEVMRHLRQKHG